MKSKVLLMGKTLRFALLILLFGTVGVAKDMAQINTYASTVPIKDTIEAEIVGTIPYNEDFMTQEEVMERNYAITSFRMIDAGTVAVLTGASDMILLYSLSQNQILCKIQLPITARAFEYDNNLFHVIGDRTYLSIDSDGRVHEREDFQQPNKEIFIITDLKIIDGQPVIHECDAKTYSITSDGLQEIDTFYYHHERGSKIHPKYIDENSFVLYGETPSKRGSINVSMESLGLEGKLSCLDYVSVNDDYIAINLQTTCNHIGGFVKSYLLVLNPDGELINLVEVPINFLSYIHKPFLYKDNAWYYAFSGQEGISIYKIDTNTNKIDSPDPFVLSDENLNHSYCAPENRISREDTHNDSTRGNWRTITQAWYNAHQYCTLEWTPIPANLATSCTWVGGSGYIITPITNYYYTETGVPYKWGGFTDRMSFKSLASEGKYTGNRVTSSSTCGGNAYSSNADTYVIGVDCSGFVSNCWEIERNTTTTIPNICNDYGLVTTASSSTFQKGDALNKYNNHVMLYTGHNSSNQITVFESSAADWKTSDRTYNTSYFSGYHIMRHPYMRNIILRLGSDIVLRQNGSTVTTVTRGQPLTVNYSVNNAGSQTWLGYVSLWIEQSDGTLSCIQGESQNGVTSLEAGRSQSFTFSNNGVISPVGTTKLYVKVKNFNAGGYYGERDYDVGSLTGANPLVFQIVEGGGGGSDCTVVPDYDYSRTVSTSWNTHTSSIESECWKIYRFSVSPDYSYCFKTGCGDGASADFDTKLFLYNSNGTQIASDDDGCSNYTSKIEYTPDASGYVYLKVAGYSDEYGNYTLAYIKNSNHNCTAIPDYDYSKTAYTTWSTHTSSIESECWKIYRFSVSPDYSYCFKTGCGDGASADFDTQLYLYNQNGTEVAFDDDECSNYTSKIEYTPNASGYVYLKVAGYSTEYGDYTLAYKKELLTPITYTISVSASPSAAGTVSGGGQYASGNSCTLTATANTGYTFTRWTKNGSSVSTNPTYSFTVTENASYVAVFSQNSYTISTSANPTAGGSVNGAGTYNYGSTCTLTATASTGYTFTRWTKNGSSVSTNPTYSFTVTGNASYVAVFSQNSYAISASANPTAGGSVSGAGTYNYGSTCTLTATANTGYTFTRWTKNGSSVSTNPTYSFTVTGNASYVAVFSQNSYAISASANPTAGGSVNGAGTYNYGSTCTLTATANTGYIFTNWTKNGTVVSTNANYGFTVTSNATYVANFESNGGNYHWIVDGGQYASTMTVLGVIRVNGVEQTETTLEVGAFCGSQCRGRERITYVPQINRYLLFLTIYGEDGNGITFRLYDHALGRELTQNCTTTVNFVTNGTLGTVSTPYPIEFSDAIVQTTSLEEGWNWWSTYIEQEGIDGLEQMEESLGENGIMIKSRNDGFVTNYGGFWLGSLLDVNNENTYLIQTNSACVMSLTGGATAASSHPIALPMGWSWIGYPNNTAMSVSTAMSGMSPKENDQLKSRESFSVYYPGIGWIGSLQTITPGMGLMFESHNTSTVTLTYPNASKSEDLKENVTARDNHWQPSMETYPDNMTVIAVVEADGVELASENYEIAAFAEGECRGSARLQYVASTGRYMAFLTIFGEKTAELGFGLYDIHTGEERYDTDNVMVYESNGSGGALFEPYKISFSEYTGVDELERLVQVYPNPVDCGQTLRVGVIVEKLSEVRIEIVDALGAVVSESTSTKMPATIKAPNAAGIYMLRIFVKGKGICCRKLVVK